MTTNYIEDLSYDGILQLECDFFRDWGRQIMQTIYVHPDGFIIYEQSIYDLRIITGRNVIYLPFRYRGIPIKYE